MARYVLDIEADNLLLDVTTIWCVVLKDIDTGEVLTYKPDELSKLKDVIESATLLIGHNVVMYDLPVLNKLLDIEYNLDIVVDTLIISRILNPDRDGGHSLDSWGKRFRKNKIEFNDFSKYSDEMLDYCIQDVEITHKIFTYLQSEAREIWDAIQMETKFAHYITKQILNGFTLDVEKVTALYNEYDKEHQSLFNTLQQILPPVADRTHYNNCKKKGLLTKETESGYYYMTEKTKVIKQKEFKYSDPNPGSRQQIIDYFINHHGWKPKEYTDKGTPKIDETILNNMPYKEAKLLGRMFRLTKTMSMIENPNGGWMHYLRDGKVHGDVLTIGTSTSRCSHSKPNLGQVDKKDLRMREVWKARDGWKLVGCDASGLELRILGHYLAPYDKGSFAYKASVPKEVADLHEDNREAARLQTRDAAKTIIYALIYGAGNKKLGNVYADDHKMGKLSDQKYIALGGEARENLITAMIGYDKLIKDVEGAYKQRGFLRAIDGRPLHPRSSYSALNLLIQSCGAIVMKKALNNFIDIASDKGYTLDVDYALVANVHDEIQIECKPEIVDEIGQACKDGIIQAGKDYKLHVDLDGEYMIGDNWKETH